MGGIFQPAKDPGPVTAGELAALDAEKANKVQENWIEVIDFFNGWIEGDPQYNRPAFYKDEFNNVRLRGVFKNGLSDNTVFILPEGYRPSKIQLLCGINGIAVGALVAVNIDGSVVFYANGQVSFFSIDSLYFKL